MTLRVSRPPRSRSRIRVSRVTSPNASTPTLPQRQLRLRVKAPVSLHLESRPRTCSDLRSSLFGGRSSSRKRLRHDAFVVVTLHLPLSSFCFTFFLLLLLLNRRVSLVLLSGLPPPRHVLSLGRRADESVALSALARPVPSHQRRLQGRNAEQPIGLASYRPAGRPFVTASAERTASRKSFPRDHGGWLKARSC